MNVKRAEIIEYDGGFINRVGGPDVVADEETRRHLGRAGQIVETGLRGWESYTHVLYDPETQTHYLAVVQQ